MFGAVRKLTILNYFLIFKYTIINRTQKVAGCLCTESGCMLRESKPLSLHP